MGLYTWAHIYTNIKYSAVGCFLLKVVVTNLRVIIFLASTQPGKDVITWFVTWFLMPHGWRIVVILLLTLSIFWNLKLEVVNLWFDWRRVVLLPILGLFSPRGLGGVGVGGRGLCSCPVLYTVQYYGILVYYSYLLCCTFLNQFSLYTCCCNFLLNFHSYNIIWSYMF